MGAPAIFEKQIGIKLLHPASTLKSRIQVVLTEPNSSAERLNDLSLNWFFYESDFFSECVDQLFCGNGPAWLRADFLFPDPGYVA
ncbi:MAG: hypothetical protein P8X79_12160 [Reinekea sp.]